MTVFALGLMGLLLTVCMASLVGATWECQQIRKRNSRRNRDD